MLDGLLMVHLCRDQGTDVVDILAGRVIPLRLGYVPVVNRGQRDIDQQKSIQVALEYERQFFENHPSYKGKAQYCGTPFLARKLNMVRFCLKIVVIRNPMQFLYRSLCTISVPHYPISKPASLNNLRNTM